MAARTASGAADGVDGGRAVFSDRAADQARAGAGRYADAVVRFGAFSAFYNGGTAV